MTRPEPWYFIAKSASIVVFALLIAVPGGDADAKRSRYRPLPGHPWLQDRETGRYPHAHCELRVPVERPLPDPISRADTGDLLSTTYLTGMTMESAGINLSEIRIADGWRVWLWRDLPDIARLRSDTRLAIAVNWPQADGGLRNEPSEVFVLPALDAHPPYRWSPWRPAAQIRDGDHAAFDTLNNAPATPVPAPAHPFELRCRTVLSEELAVPAAADDPEIRRDETGRSVSAPDP
jgi:hypothetical protein